MADNLESFATEEFIKLIRKAKKIGQVVALNVTDRAPKGWTGQLKRSIRADKPQVINDQVFVSVSAFATSKTGFNYALFQHDEILRHYHPEGQKTKKGYSDFGTGKTREKRYASGYAKESPKSDSYATEYMNRGLDDSGAQIDKILDS